MFEFLKHITPKIKILSLSLFLILLPGAVISYLSLRSIREKAENQRIKYLGTVNLVRDKLESELYQLETNFRNSIIESIQNLANETDLQDLIHRTEINYPSIRNVFILGYDNELITSHLTLGLQETSQLEAELSGESKRIFSLAEKEEFIDKNYHAAISLYRNAFKESLTPGQKALIYSRIGRNYYKLQQYEKGIPEYKKILELSDESLSFGSVPASIVAISQITYGYKELGAIDDRNKDLLQLYENLLHQPWDLSGGEYMYYLKSTTDNIREIEASLSSIYMDTIKFNGLISLEKRLLDQSTFIHHLSQGIQDELISELLNLSASEIRHKPYRAGQGKTIELGYFKLQTSHVQTQLIALGFQFDEDYLLSELFPRALSSVELGRDITVGILDQKDSLMFLQDNLQLSSYLVAEDFTHSLFTWKVGLFDKAGRSIEQLSGRERHLYLGLFLGILAVMLLGIIILARAVIHETEVSRMKSEFVSNVTHELKTPLSLIRMFGETLDSGIVSDEDKKREFYRIIRKESERLSHLIDNVLDFSQLDTGDKKYNFEDADLVGIIKHSLEAYKFHIREKGFEIESKMPEESVIVCIDKDAISQAFLNLLSNSVKYSEDRKHIEVEIAREKNWAIIAVSDQGVGISRDELKKIFDKFYRAPNNMVKQSRGSGLGLTIAKHIIDAHRGNIEVASEPGKGSTFTIRIPLSVDS